MKVSVPIETPKKRGFLADTIEAMLDSGLRRSAQSVNWRTVIVLPESVNFPVKKPACDSDVIVVCNSESEEQRVRGRSVSRIILISLTEEDLRPELLHVLQLSTCTHRRLLGTDVEFTLA